jgi:hypothetical protein
MASQSTPFNPNMLAVTSVSKREGVLICRITYRDAKRKPEWQLFTDVPTKLKTQYYLARLARLQKRTDDLQKTSTPSAPDQYSSLSKSSNLPSTITTMKMLRESKLLNIQPRKRITTINETVVSVRKPNINRNNFNKTNRVRGRRLRVRMPQIRSTGGNGPGPGNHQLYA